MNRAREQKPPLLDLPTDLQEAPALFSSPFKMFSQYRGAPNYNPFPFAKERPNGFGPIKQPGGRARKSGGSNSSWYREGAR